MDPHWNLAPTQDLAVITNREPRKVQLFRWGLLPFWARSLKEGARMINARSDSVAEKPAFKKAFQRKRCLILADGFYEWKALDKKRKQPYFIGMRGRKPFAFAGLWESWRPPDGSEAVHTCSVITTDANRVLARLHDRMPVILPESSWQQWLDREEERPDVLLPLLKPYPQDEMESFPVSTLVNSPANDTADVLQRVDEPEPELF
jgi:putative SOS response-associated peptidase YedK